MYTSVADVAAQAGVLNCAAALPVIRKEGDALLFDGLTFAHKNGTAGYIVSEDVLGVKLLCGDFENGDSVTVPLTSGDKRGTMKINGAKSCVKTKFEDDVLHVYADVRLRAEEAENPGKIVG